MAKQKPGVYDRVLECAKEEFLLQGGFLDASLRTIAQEAGTSTRVHLHPLWGQGGSVSGHRGAVVDEFRAMFREIQESFHQLDNETQRAEMGQYTARHQMDLLDLHLRHTLRRVPPPAGWGARHPVLPVFLDELVDIEVEYTYQYMEGHRLREREVRSGNGGVHPHHRHRLFQRDVRGGAPQHGPRRSSPLCEDAQRLPYGGLRHCVRSPALNQAGCRAPFWAQPFDFTIS